ncbi:UV-endonuclease UvdE-domain-containing protein [Phaeosphaeria sp. MPI-PUGE-AT-0046c]|nr:UV-endonuclease UvdE-domain-containing protein [Phaeosphaeria sp. MPI-PUGE-AT-0046c]
MAKRKRSVATAVLPAPTELSSLDKSKITHTGIPLPTNVATDAPKSTRRQSSRGGKSASTNPDINPDVLDGISALRASPDGQEVGDAESHLGPGVSNGVVNGYAQDANNQMAPPTKIYVNGEGAGATNTADSSASKGRAKKASTTKIKVEPEESKVSTLQTDMAEDPEEADGLEEDETEFKEALSRPPPVNSDYLPLPWKGRLGYHRHPLKDPSQPEHATKNRPDKEQPADVARGMRYVEQLGLANARDVTKMVRWNDKYGIKFMRLSSEMFPFASHEEYGYKLEPFAADTLRDVGKVIAELGHRVTTHPGQFTQLGSPRKTVIDNAIRDLEFHDELLSLLKLPPQQNRDAVMILHLGGAFGDKPAAIARFKENYARLPQSVKNRLVLENDDVVWSVHELLPLCQELNIPMVLDFHHHNIIFDATQIREGTKDIMDLYPAILETWSKKGITPKMHYSESRPEAVTRTKRRKHSPRVMTLPPCPDTMDLMIEAKDKEQAVFELMRTFKLPGFHTFNDVLPHVRQDENKPWKPKPKKAVKKSKKKTDDLNDLDAKIEDVEEEDIPPPIVPDADISMGGPEGRVYWPPGMEDWLRPPKRIIKKKEEGAATPAKKKRKTAVAAGDEASVTSESAALAEVKPPAKKTAPKRAASSTKKKTPKAVPTPSPSDEDDHLSSPPLSDVGTEDDAPVVQKRAARSAPSIKKSGRATARVSYKEEDAEEMSM